MKRLRPILHACLWYVLASALCASAHGEINYDVVGQSVGTHRFDRAAKLFIGIDAQCPAAHRAEMERVAAVARQQGLNCVPRKEAEFVLVVNFVECQEMKNPPGYTRFSINGLLFAVPTPGAKPSEFSMWEGAVSGRTAATPYVQPDEVARKLLEAIDVTFPSAPKPSNEMVITGEGPAVSAEGLPTEYVKAEPKTKEFNAIARKLFEGDPIDFAKAEFDPAKLRSLQGQTATEIFHKLKQREKEFGGAIRVFPVPADNENVIEVHIRIVRQSGKNKTLYTRSLLICLSKGNWLKSVERSIYIKQPVK